MTSIEIIKKNYSTRNDDLLKLSIDNEIKERKKLLND